jgi:hypothetical protein
MSTPFALAAVSAVLRRLLSVGLADLAPFGNVAITALPPDRIALTPNEPSQLNLFLYRVTLNSGWRNMGLPTRSEAGERLTNPPLALDLHYLLTAYGAEEFFPEALLGYGMQVFHETPGLGRQFIRDTWVGGALTPPEEALAATGLADQIEQIKIAVQDVNSEELSKLWTAFQTKYRPSAAYQVSVVLIEGTRATRTALPVLKRGRDDRGPVAVAPPFPTLTRVHPASAETLPAARLGDDLAIIGTQLNDEVRVRVSHTRLPIAFELTPLPASTPNRLLIHLPGAAEGSALDDWAIGFYSLALVIRRPDLPAWTTNAIAFALAPTVLVERPPGQPAPLAVVAGSEVVLTCAPRIPLEQRGRVEVLVGMSSAVITAITTPADPALPTTVRFTMPNSAAGEYVVRLRVDGVESLPVLIGGSPPTFDFDPQQKVRIP